jgi:hypothetical protein
MSSSAALEPAFTRDPARLRHPRETRVATIVSIIDAMLVVVVVAILLWGTEWLETVPSLAKYETHARILVALIVGAPILATFARRRRRLLVQQESIRISSSQLPEVHAVLVKHCGRLGIPLPELYLSDGVDHTTSFSWRDRHCIILSTHDYSTFPDAFDDVVDWVLAREVGAICLGHTSYRSELLASSVAPIPFLRGPLNHLRTYSRDRYGAFLAPRSFRALIVAASGDRLRNRVDLAAFFAQLDEERSSGLIASVLWLFKRRVPLAYRVQELRRAGLLDTG